MWIVLITLSAFLWAVVNTVDKTLIGNRLQNPYPILIRFCILAIIAGSAGFAWVGGPITGASLALIIVSGITASLSWVCYYWAIPKEEVSRIIPIYALEPVIVIIAGIILLKESVAPVQMFGAVAIILGSFMLNPVSRIRASKASAFIAAGAVLIAVETLCLKGALSTSSSMAVFFLNLAITGIAGMAVSKIAWRHTAAIPQSMKIGLWAYTAGFFIPSLFFILALSRGPASLVAPASSSQYVFLFLLTTLVSRWKPKMLNETASRKIVAWKAASIAFIIAGVFFIR